MKKVNISLLLGLASAIVFSLALFSCSNASNGYDPSSHRNSYPVVRFVANMNSDISAAPEEISDLVSCSAGTGTLSGAVSRSAMPEISIDATGYGTKYYVEAETGTPGKDSYTRHFVFGAASTLELGLESGKTWKVTCGIGKIDPDPDNPDDAKKGIVTTKYMTDTDPSVTITPDEPVYVKTFGLKPFVTEGGKGGIELYLNAPEGYKIKTDSQTLSWFHNCTFTPNGLVPISSGGNNLKSGSYEVIFKAYDTNNVLIYCTTQIINIFDNMTTNQWRDDGSGVFKSHNVDGKSILAFDVDNPTLITEFVDNTIYVGATGFGLDPDDSNAGTAFTPLKKLNTAFEKIKNYGNGKEYRIYISGTIDEPNMIVAGINTEKAASITIEGYNGLGSADGMPQDKILGQRIGTPASDTACMSISATAPIITQNIWFTKSSSVEDDEKSRALWLQSNANVTLGPGTVISGFNAGSYYGGGSGGGVYVESGASITVKGAVIKDNRAYEGGGIYIDGDGSVTMSIDGSQITENHALDGGGISVKGAKVKITKTSISGNKADLDANYDSGGGLSLDGGADVTLGNGAVVQGNTARSGGGVNMVGGTLTLDGGQIIQNKAELQKDSDTAGSGGGIHFNQDSCKIYVYRGSISGNTAANLGGGIRFDGNWVVEESDHLLHITGGTIENNKAAKGGAMYIYPTNWDDVDRHFTFNLGGSAYIPYGVNGAEGAGKNDIFFDGPNGSTYASIVLQSALAKHNKDNPIAIRINEGSGKRGVAVVQASSSLEKQKDSFKLYSDDWDLKLSDSKTSLTLDSPIWVASADAAKRKQAGAPSASGLGTKGHPFDTIENACGLMEDDGVDYTIYVDGTITGSQTIPANVVAKSITIQGVNNDKNFDVLDATGSDSRVLTFNNGLASKCADIVIRELKITGANISGSGGSGIYCFGTGCLTLSNGALVAGNTLTTSGDGAGVRKQCGKLIIEDGAEVSGNTAQPGAKGGGVAVVSAQFVMSGGKIFGNHADCTNTQAGIGGGVYLTSNGSATTSMVMSGGQISANSSFGGGGIYCDPGTDTNGIKIFLYGSATIGGGEAVPSDADAALAAGGNIAVGNPSNMTSFGGGICACKYTKVYLGYKPDNSGNPVVATGKDKLTGGVIGNYTERNAGGIFVLDGAELHFASGTVAYNKALTAGGAVLNRAVFSIGDDAYIPAAEGTGCNDICLDQTKKMDLANSLTKHGASNPIAITLSNAWWSQGDTVIASNPERVLSSDDLNCFKLTAEHEAAGLNLLLSSDCKSVKLDKPIYVRRGGTPSPDTADGTKTKPFASIAAACDASVMTNASLDYTILVDGINPDSGYSMPLQGAQTIPATATAKSITIMGANGLYTEGTQAGQPKDALDGNSCYNPVLKALCACPVILGNIKITKAYNTSSNGGGVYREDGDLYIQEGTLITDNTAKAGYGVYMYGKTKTVNLYMSGGKVTSNKNYGDEVSSGGAVYANKGDEGSCNVFIYGSAVIGGVSKSNPKWSTDKSTVLYYGGNYGVSARGGGVCCCGNLYLGYKSASGLDGAPTSDDVEEWTGAICGNYAGKGYRGGGVCVYNGKLYMNSGEISYNCQIRDESNGQGGGGIGAISSAYIELSGGKIHHNYTPGYCGGGGVAVSDSVGQTFKMTGGEIYENQSRDQGGGVSVQYADSFIMSGGNIYGNQAGCGGGIYTTGKVFICGSAVIGKDGDPVTSETSESVSNKATACGGGICAYRDGVVYLGYKSAKDDGSPNEPEEWTGGIYCNSAQYGGGIGGWYTTSYIEGIYMNSGTIKGNYASKSGGGINNPGEMYMTGGLITKNNCASTAKGSGVYIAGSSCVFQMSGPACILPESDGSNEFYAANKITIAGPLAPTVTGKAGDAAADYAACIEPKDYTKVLLEVVDGLNLSEWTPFFKIKPQPDPDAPALPDGLGYGAGADGIYNTDRFLVSSSSDEVLTAMNDLIKNSSKDNPVNLCFTTDFAPSSYVASGNDTNFTDTASIIRVMSGKSVNITATKPITIKNTFGGGPGCIVYCENGYLTIDENITIEQNNSNSSEYGVRINGGEATLNGCEIKNSKGRGLYVWSGNYSGYGWHCPYAKVTVNAGTKIHDCGDSGIFVLQDSSTLFLNGVDVYNCKGSGIWLTTYGRVVCPNNDAVNISNNTYNNSACQVYFYNNSGGKWGASESELQEYTKNLKWTTFPPPNP